MHIYICMYVCMYNYILWKCRLIKAYLPNNVI